MHEFYGWDGNLRDHLLSSGSKNTLKPPWADVHLVYFYRAL